MKLPAITAKQQEILKLLYRHRYLDRTQLQVFLRHKDKRRIGAWLKDLREKQYVEWIYSTDFAEKTKLATYYIGINGIRFLKTLEAYPAQELRKRYAESSRKRAFIDRCLLLADCCVNLETRSADGGGLAYTYSLEADYADLNNKYHFLVESELIHPHLCYLKTEESKGDVIETIYLVEVFDATMPRYMVKKKLKGYLDFLDDEWGDGMEDLPIVHIGCPGVAELAYAKRYTRKILEDAGQEDDKDIHIRFTTIEKIKTLGITGRIWEEV